MPKMKGTVRKAVASARASVTAEGLNPSRKTITIGRQMLEGKISGKEAIALVKAQHIASKRYER